MNNTVIKSFFVAIAMTIIVFATITNAAPAEHKKVKLEWENPCGGIFNETNRGKENATIIRARYRRTQLLINITTSNAESEMKFWATGVEKWQNHKKNYTFLPVHNPKSQPRKWHSDLQIYTGTLHNLLKKAKKAHKKHELETKVDEDNLKTLLESSQSILCHIEELINATTNKLPPTFTLVQMNRKTRQLNKFRIDVVFVKFKFLNYIQKFNKTIERRLKKSKDRYPNSSSSMGSSSLSASGSLEVTERPSIRKSPTKKRSINNSQRRRNNNMVAI